jgi:hypothetical protein
MGRTALKAASLLMTGAATAAALLGAPLTRAAAAGLIPGEQRRWALELRVRLNAGGGQPVEITLSGDWISTVSAVRRGEYDAALQIAGGHLRGHGSANGAPDAIEEVERRLARLFWATYRDDGALLAVHFFKDVKPSDRNLLEMIAAETQLVRPDRGEPQWSEVERDGAGSYLATYERTPSDLVVKHKLKYLDTNGVAGAPKDQVQVTVERSELRFSLGPDGEVATLDGTDQVSLGLLPGASVLAPLAATTEIHLSNLRRSQAPDLIGSLAHALPAVLSSPIATYPSDAAETRAESDDRLLEGRTTESLLEASMAKDTDSLLPERLAALFRRRPEATTTAVALLRKSGAQKRITDALGSANSAEAIRALGSLARDAAAPAVVRVDALTALIRVQHPSLEAMRIPVALLDDDNPAIESAARMVSGALARAARAEHREEADAIDEALIARYRKALEVAKVCDLLGALGNSVGPSTVPLIEEALHDARGPVRAAAARALRLAPGPEIDRVLSAAITSDLDPAVRSDALFAVGFRRPLSSQLGEALVHAARTDPIDYVRSNAVMLLRQNPGASPSVVTTLAWVAEHDPKPGIRRLARQALPSVPEKSLPVPPATPAKP